MITARSHQSSASLLPYHLSELSPRRLRAFASFLHQSGAEIFLPLGSHEVFRFRASGKMATIYRRGDGSLSFAGPVAEAWEAFTGHIGYRARPMARHPRGSERTQLIATLVARDGRICFYCHEPIPPGFETIEF